MKKLTVLLGIAIAAGFTIASLRPDATMADLRFHRGKIDLGKELHGDWDRVCLYAPYSTNETALEASGVATDIEKLSEINGRDDISLLVTLHGDALIKVYQVKRVNIDFSALAPLCLAREQARFAEGESGPLLK